MTDLTDLRDRIDDLLNIPAVGMLLQLNSNTAERAYEAYILSLCVEAVRRAGGQTTLVGIQSGADPTTIVFRGAPGSMYSQAQDYCYVQCRLGNENFEIHVDVEYEGQTGATHEVDVSICNAEHCNRVRSTNRSPRTNKLIMLFECKFYENSTPGVNLVRAFIGLRSDCTQYQMSGFISNITTQNIRTFLSKKTFPEPYTPLPSDGSSEERFIRNVEQTLRKWAGV